MNPYEILGVKKTANQKQIKDAYRKLSKKHHPDKGGNAENFVQIQNAYDILSDEKSRKRYDETGDISSGKIPVKTAGRNLLLGVWEQLVEMDLRINQLIKLPDALISKLKDIKKDMRTKREQTTEDISIYQKIMSRLIYKGGCNDFLNLTLQHKIDNAKRMVQTFNRRVEEVEAAENLAKEYDYQSEFQDETSYAKHTIGDDLAKAFRLT